MFSIAIDRSPFIGEDADAIFQNINADEVGSDKSFTATLRACLAPHMAKDESLYCNYVAPRDSSMFGADRIDDGSAVSYIADLVPSYDEEWDKKKMTITIVNVSCIRDEELRTRFFDKITSSFHPDSYVRNEKITLYYREAFPVYAYISAERRSVFIITSFNGLRGVHFLQCGILSCLPWFIQKDTITPEEDELMRSLTERTPDHYLACIERMAAKYNFKDAKVRRLLDGIETSRLKQQLEEQESELPRYEDRLRRLYDDIATMVQARENTLVQIIGLKEKIKHDSAEPSPLMQYFLHNEAVELESRRGSQITISVFTPCLYYNMEEAKRVIENDDADMYEDSAWSYEDLSKLLTAIFLKQTLKLRFYAKYNINLDGSVEGVQGTTPTKNGYISNPHISGYSCLGTNSRAVAQLLSSHQYAQAIDQCVASAGGLSFTDHTVLCEFASRITNTNRTCIELPDGRVVNPSDALEYLNEMEAA